MRSRCVWRLHPRRSGLNLGLISEQSTGSSTLLAATTTKPRHTKDDMNDDTPERCGTCFYFEHPKCRRYPPTPQGGWVHVGTEDWCGEHATVIYDPTQPGGGDVVKRSF